MSFRIVMTRALPGPAVERLAAHGHLRLLSDRAPPAPRELRASLADCQGLLCTLTEAVDAALLEAAPELRVVSTCSVGVDHVDVAALTRRGIPLGHTPGVLSEATADLAFALLLAVARRLPEAERFVRTGQWTAARRWEPDLLLGRDLRGTTLGLLGLGAVGQGVARRALGFGMRVIGWTPSGRAVPGVEPAALHDVLAECDVLSLHLALTATTARLIDARALAAMRPGAILVNTARGGLVDEHALVAALRAGRLGGAALDVFAEEPLAPDHPLLSLPNVIVVPHIGSATRGTRAAMAELAADNLLAGLRGERLPCCANPEVYDAPRSAGA